MIAPAVALTALAAVAAVTVPVSAAPLPTERTITDARESGKAWDVVRVTLTAASAEGAKAKVVVRHTREADAGDGVEMWMDTDADAVPDLYLIGYAYSEYVLYRASGWDGHGRDISDRGCASMRITGKRTVVRFAPDCVGPSSSFAVSVRSSVQGRPARTADQVPGPDRLTKYVVSYAA